MSGLFMDGQGHCTRVTTFSGHWDFHVSPGYRGGMGDLIRNC